MAGIFGVIYKNKDITHKENFEVSLKKIQYNEKQGKYYYQDDYIEIGVVTQINRNIKANYYWDEENDVLLLLDGLCFVDKAEKELLKSDKGFKGDYSEIEYINLLLKKYNYKEIVNNLLCGNYNIVIYFKKKKKTIIYNDYLGMLPLYLHENKENIIFSSKLDPLLSYIKNPSIDKVSVLEAVIFNYIISDNTIIENIQTIENASSIEIINGSLIKKKYWDINEFFRSDQYERKESQRVFLDSLKKSCLSIFDKQDEQFSLSFTGGWDSRVILSNVIKEHRDKLLLYSFGRKDSSDIKIPEEISHKENLHYTPYVLDDKYLDNKFINNAIDTISLSSGTRNYKRAHYLYSIKEVSKNSTVMISGIYGDQVYKVGKPKANQVISQSALELIQKRFNAKDSEYFMVLLKENAHKLGYKENIIESMLSRLSNISYQYKDCKNAEEIYAKFRFECNLRKYFGAEVNSYNDFILVYSPFIERPFLKEYFKTTYSVEKTKFNKASLFAKDKTNLLYYKTVQSNYPNLALYNSARNYSMRDSTTKLGKIKILAYHFIGDKEKNSFNTDKTQEIFIRHIFKDGFVNKKRIYNANYLSIVAFCLLNDIKFI